MSEKDKVEASSAKMPAVLTPMALARSPGVSKVFILTPEILQKLGLPGHMTARIASQDQAKQVDSPIAEGSHKNPSNEPSNTIKLVIQPIAGSIKRKRDSTSEQNAEKSAEILKSRITTELEQRLNGSNQKPTEETESLEDGTWSTPKIKKKRRKSSTPDVKPQNSNNENTNKSNDETSKSTPGVRTSKRVIKFKKFDDYVLTDDILTLGAGSSNTGGKVKQRRSSSKKTDSVEQPHSTISNKETMAVNSRDIVGSQEKDSETRANEVDPKEKYLEARRRVSTEDIRFKVPESHNNSREKQSPKTYAKIKPKEKREGTVKGETAPIASNPGISETKKIASPINVSRMKSQQAETGVKVVERKIVQKRDEAASRLETAASGSDSPSLKKESVVKAAEKQNVKNKRKSMEKFEASFPQESSEAINAKKETCKTYVKQKLKEKIGGGNEGKSDGVEAGILNSNISIENSSLTKNIGLNALKSPLVGDNAIVKVNEKHKSRELIAEGTPVKIKGIIPIMTPVAIQGPIMKAKKGSLGTVSSEESLATSSPHALTIPRKSEEESSGKQSATLASANKNEEGSTPKFKIPRISERSEEDKASSSEAPKILLKTEENFDSKPKTIKILQFDNTGSVSQLQSPKTSTKNEELAPLSMTPKLVLENKDGNDSKPKTMQILQINKDGSDSKPKTMKILQINKDGSNSKPKTLKILQINKDGSNAQPKTMKILKINEEGNVSKFKIPKISRQREGESPSRLTTLPFCHKNGEENASKPSIPGYSCEKEEIDDTRQNSREFHGKTEETPVPLLLPDKREERNVTSGSPMPIDLLTSKSLDKNIKVSASESESQTSVDPSGGKSRSKPNNQESNVTELLPSEIPDKNEETVDSELKSRKALNKTKKMIVSEPQSAKSAKDKKITASEFKSPRSRNKKEKVVVSDLESPKSSTKREKVLVSDLESPKSSNKREKVLVSDLESLKSSTKNEKVLVSDLESPKSSAKKEKVLVSDLESPKSSTKTEKVIISDLGLNLASNKKDTVFVPGLELPKSEIKKDIDVVSVLESPKSQHKVEKGPVSDLELPKQGHKKEKGVVPDWEPPTSLNKKAATVASELESPMSPDEDEETVASQLEAPQFSDKAEETIASELKSPEASENKVKVCTPDLKPSLNEKEEIAASKPRDDESPVTGNKTTALELKSPQSSKDKVKLCTSEPTTSLGAKEEIADSKPPADEPQTINNEPISSELKSPSQDTVKVRTSEPTTSLDEKEEITNAEPLADKSPTIRNKPIASEFKSPQFLKDKVKVSSSEPTTSLDEKEKITDPEPLAAKSPTIGNKPIASEFKLPQLLKDEVKVSSSEPTTSLDDKQEITDAKPLAHESQTISNKPIVEELETPQSSKDKDKVSSSEPTTSLDENEEITDSKPLADKSPTISQKTIASKLKSSQFSENKVKLCTTDPTTSLDENEEIADAKPLADRSPTVSMKTIASKLKSSQFSENKVKLCTSEPTTSLDENEGITDSKPLADEPPTMSEKPIALKFKSRRSSKDKMKGCTSEPTTVDENEKITESKPLADKTPTTRNKFDTDAQIPLTIENNSNVENIGITLNESLHVAEAMEVEISLPAPSIPDVNESPCEEPPIRRRRGRPRKVVLPKLVDEPDPSIEKEEIAGIEATVDIPSTKPPAEETPTMNVEKSLSTPIVSNANDSPPTEAPVPRKRGRPRKVVLPISEDDSEPNLEKEEIPSIESTADTTAPAESLVIGSTCRTKRPARRLTDGTDGKGLSEESEDDDDTFKIRPTKRRGRPPGIPSRSWTTGRGRGKNRGFARGRGRGRGRGGSIDVDYTPRVASTPDKHNEQESSVNLEKPQESSVNSEEPKPDIPIVSEVECAKCKRGMMKKEWPRHNTSAHNGMGWLTGMEEPDFDNDVKLLRSILMATLKKKSALICEICGDGKRSANGFISHLQFCGKTDEERVSLLWTCPICNNVMMPSSMEYHERTHRQVVKTDNERKWEEAVEPRDASSSRGKRKAAEKAATIISKFTELVKDDAEVKMSKQSELNGMIKKPQCPNNPPNLWRGIWKRELSAGGKGFCRQPGCQFSGNTMDIMYEHNAVCPLTPTPTFVCKICDFSSPSEQTINKHVLNKHWDGRPDTDSDRQEYDSSSGSGSDGEHAEQGKPHAHRKEPERYRPQNTGIKFLDEETPIHPKWPVSYPPALRWTMKFELENFRMRLFENLSPRSMHLMKYETTLEYLPELSQSMQVKVIEKGAKKEANDWVRWDRFQGSVVKGVPSFFTGGPVWALAWLPIPAPMYNSEVDQYVAVSTHPSMESTYTVGKSYTGKNMIQIWKMGHLDHRKNANLQAPEFAYGVTHDKGTIWCLEWCPSGCYEHENIPDSLTNKTLNDGQDKRRMGLLAAACSDGCVHVFSLPFPEELHFGRNEKDPADYRPIYETKPVLTLTLNASQYEKGEQNWQCTCLHWSKHLGHDTIIAGFSNGYVALWDPSTTSPLLIYSRGETTTIDAFHSLYAHGHAVSSVHMIAFGGKRFFYTTGYDRLTKLWDIEDLSLTVDIARRGIITAGAILTNWTALVTAYDDAYGLANAHSYLVSLREPGTKVLAVLPTKSTIYGVATSDYANSISQGTAAGEVLVMFPHQLWGFKDMDRDVPKKRWLASVTQIVDLKFKGVKTGVKRKNMEKEYVYKPETYNGCDERYGICFRDELTRSKHDSRARHPKQSCTGRLSSLNIEQYPFASVNRLSWNPNAWSYLWLGLGYQNGFVRFLNFNAVALDRELSKLLPSHAKSMLGGETSEANDEEAVDVASQIDSQAES